MPDSRSITHSTGGSSLAEVLERVLDKGIVIAGDIKIYIANVELLAIKIRLLIASADKAREMGIDWWEHDPALCSRAAVAALSPECQRPVPNKHVTA